MGVKSKSLSENGIIRRHVLYIIRGLAGTAAALSAYLGWISFGGVAVAGCGPGGGCQEVLHSKWAYWLNVPVSLLAFAVYLLILIATLWLHRDRPTAQQRIAWQILFPCALVVLGAAFWFTALQLLVIKRVCPVCMTTHGCGLLLGSLLLLTVPLRRAPQKHWEYGKKVFLPPKLACKLSLAAMAALLTLMLVQWEKPHRTHSETPLVSGADLQPHSMVTSNVPAPALVREIQVYGGLFRLNLYEVPIIGSPTASNAIVSLFDYTCHHCRLMHKHLLEAQKTFGERLAIANLPMPLASECNPSVRRTAPAHTNACDYARLGLAVWHAKRAEMLRFDEYVFTPETPPPLDQAKAFAESLVGTVALEQALQGPWVSEQLQKDIGIYQVSYLQFRNGGMPQLIVGTNLAAGSLDRIEDLYRLLEKTLGLRPGS